MAGPQRRQRPGDAARALRVRIPRALPCGYHTNRRIEQAKALLALPSRSVTEIALDLGFSETSSFSAAFRKLTSQTPTEYRRSLT